MNFVKLFLSLLCLVIFLLPEMGAAQGRFADSPYRTYWEGQMQWTAESKRPATFTPKYRTQRQAQIESIDMSAGTFPVEAVTAPRIDRMPVEANAQVEASVVEPVQVVPQEPVEVVVEPEPLVQTSPVAPSKGTVLIVAPHPDDEILCCARTIAQKKAEGYAVKILYITNGDAYQKGDFDRSKDYATARKNESLDAIERLGVTLEDTYWLNFPDSQLENLGDEVLVSPYTGQNRAREESTYPNTLYTRDNLMLNITQVLVDAAPQQIYLPNPETDIHPDHRVTGVVFAELLDPLANPPELFFYQVHGTTHGVETSNGIVDAEKLALIRYFKSQYHDQAHKIFMDSFAMRPETFVRD